MRPAEEQSRLRIAGESIQAFYPLILSVFATPLIIKFDVLWVGILLGVILLALHKTWWTCIFGLLNSMAVIAMMLACVVAWIVGNRNETNRVEATGLRPSPLPHHPACGSAPGGSNQTL
jgi:MFS superfamily sulfate permease-like transporter